MGYNRSAHIHEQLQHWGTSGDVHTPIHSHLTEDKKSFTEAYSLGRLMEELTRPLLYQRFPTARIIAHCDTTLASRRAGKRAWLAGQECILPDYEIHTPTGMAFCLDIKSKQYHSYYHRDREVQQFIDEQPLQDYIRYGDSMQLPALILFHLWPSAAMALYGKSDEARIHTGHKHTVLSIDALQALLRRYPVDDAYYLVNAKQLLTHGRKGGNKGAPGYYLGVQHMPCAVATLPALGEWERLCAMPF